MVKHLSDEQLKKLTLGGHDPVKVYNAFKRAVDTKGMPTVVLARTIKGYGIGESGEGKNVTHNQKKMNDSEVMAVPHPLRHPDLGRRRGQRAVLPARPGQRGGEVPRRAAQGHARPGAGAP